MNTLCVPKQTENLLRLSPLFRDYFGEQMARFTERLDGFPKAGCFVPRFFHAPGSQQQLAGIPPNGYAEYLLALPIGAFLVGFLHTTSSAPASVGSASQYSPNVPPNASGFTMQITDLGLNHKLFSRPVEEAWFLNDNLLGASAFPPYENNTLGFTFPSFVRLLPVPYPIVSPGQLQIEIWNALDTDNLGNAGGNNTDCQMTFLVLVPDGVNQNAGKGSGK